MYAPQAHNRVSNINFDIWKQIVERGLYEYPMKNISRTAKFLPIFSKVKGIARVFNWHKFLGGIMHLKSGQDLCRPWYIFNVKFIETPLYNLFSNIKVDIWHPAVGLRFIIPPRNLSQLNTRTAGC
jgi:hypothetical protein